MLTSNMKLIATFILTVFLCLAFAFGQASEFYVSNNDGSDSWDGTSETNVDGSDVGPWKTLSHAIEEIRKIRPIPPTASDRVNNIHASWEILLIFTT